jgi:ornithine cyclodeaminase/alanine dehydrogenase
MLGPARRAATVSGGVPPLRYLAAADIERLGVDPGRLREAIAAAYAVDGARSTLKAQLAIERGSSVLAMPAIWPARGLAAVKWVTVTRTEGAPGIAGLVVLDELRTGAPLAIMDAGWITAARTAAMSAIAARSLANPAARSIGFVGCGVQARSHLEALRRVLPRLERVVAFSRSAASAEQFVAAARAAGMAAAVTGSAREAVEGIEVVVTTVPDAPGFEPFLEPAWLNPGALAIAVDLGRSWRPDGLRALDIIATDDREQSEVLGRAGKLAYPGPFGADLAELVAAGRRTTPSTRAMFLFAGDARADIAAAALVYDEAQRRDVGIVLPR